MTEANTERTELGRRLAEAREAAGLTQPTSGNFINPYQRRQVTPDPPEFATLTRTATCNAQGFFRFENVGDGEFILLTRVVWTVGRSNVQEGGFLIGRATVRGGQTVEVTLTPS